MGVQDFATQWPVPRSHVRRPAGVEGHESSPVHFARHTKLSHCEESPGSQTRSPPASLQDASDEQSPLTIPHVDIPGAMHTFGEHCLLERHGPFASAPASTLPSAPASVAAALPDGSAPSEPHAARRAMTAKATERADMLTREATLAPCFPSRIACCLRTTGHDRSITVLEPVHFRVGQSPDARNGMRSARGRAP